MPEFETPQGYRYAYLMHTPNGTHVMCYWLRSICNDNPIRYTDGRIAYDAPERVGKCARREVRRLFDQLRREGRPAKNDYLTTN